MLAYAILASFLAVGAQAVAAPAPAITAPPSLKHRRDLGDFFDSFKSGVNEVASGAGDIASNIGQGVDCFDKVEDILDDEDDIPTASGELGTSVTDYLGKNGNNCAATAMPSSLSQSYQQYESRFVDWYSKARPAIQSAADACPSIPADFQKAVQPCSTALEAAGITPVAFDTEGNGSNNDATSTDDDNAAPRVTGVAVGAAVLAVGAVAALF